MGSEMCIRDRERVPELALSVGAGFGFRALARELLQFVPFAGWAVKAGVAYTGTRALGEAATRRFELGLLHAPPAKPPVRG